MYNMNGLPFWAEDQIEKRGYLIKYLSSLMMDILVNINPAWHMVRIESPILTPTDLINPAYSEDEYYNVGELSLRPETTIGSYTYIKGMLNSHPAKWLRPPICIWQSGKSFRKEQDQPTKYCRFKEFYQLEFQCIYSMDSKCDYYSRVLEGLTVLKGVRLVTSERLPSYSEITTDIEIEYKGRWMEIASISKRTDFEPGYRVVEVAFGLDRMVLAGVGI